MKKVLVLVMALALLSPIFGMQKAKAVDVTKDQYCVFSDESNHEIIGQNGVNSQTFVPTKDRLSYIDMKVFGSGLNGTTSIVVTVAKSPDGDVIGTASIQPTMTKAATLRWTFTTPLVLDTSSVYQIRMTEGGSASVYWYYKLGDLNCDGNVRTKGFRDSTHQSWDFNYATWGYNEPVQQNSNANTNLNANTNSALPAGQTVGTGTAPSTTTSASIKVASALKVEYANSAANLSWTKSATTDIDGYKIFRSESATKSFTEIGKTVKATLTYADSKDLVVGKTYYYFVRAYKTSDESASTATVALLIPEATVATVTNAKTNSIKPISVENVDETDYTMLQIYWITGWIVAVLIIILCAYEIDKKKKGGFTGAKHFRLLK